MPDLPIVIPDTVVAPKDYTLSGTQELQLKTVRALIDGSAAASAFLPTLQLLDPNGHVMWEGATSSTVAAGGSADVSWFPGLTASGSVGPPGPAASLAVASLFSSGAGETIVADNAVHYVSLQDGIAGAGFATTDASTFANLSSTLFTGVAVYGIGIQQAGTYAVYNNAFTMSAGTAGHEVNAYWAASNGSSPSFFQQGRSANVYAEQWDTGQAGVGPHLFLHEWMTVTVAQTPAVLVVYGRVNGGADPKLAFQMMVVQLTPSVLSKL